VRGIPGAEPSGSSAPAREGQGVTSIEFEPLSRTFLLATASTGYAVRLRDDGVRQVCWGARLTASQAAGVPLRDSRGDGDGEILGEEFPGEGGLRFGPPALAVEMPDGTRGVELTHADHDIDGNHLRIGLTDDHYPLRLDLHYRLHDDSDVIERWATLTHTGSIHTGDGDPITVERFDSAAWMLPQRADYRLTQVTGEWAAEFAVTRTPLPYGESGSTSRRGTTRHQANPWLAIDAGDATEEHGEVWAVALAWSGGFRLNVRRSLGGHVRVLGGADHDGAPSRRLRAGEQWSAPIMAGVYTPDGFTGVSHAFHGYALAQVLPHPDEVPPVLYNSWEGTWFGVDETNQIALAREAAALGVELFVMDDGWFGRRIDDRAGLGDWWPNPHKFPDGLGPLAAEVHSLGMRFGLWVEPEMVNADSDLYRAHPDWVLHMAHRRRTEIRHQMVLNFARPDVAEWAYGWLDELVARDSIDFLKWDMNRVFTEAGWPDSDDPGRLWIDHTRNVYAVIDRLRLAHPELRIESCASGGGRADLGILARTDQVWTSDNTDPVDRIAIQHGFSQIYPAMVMGAWASESPNPIVGRTTPLRFRFHVAMAGALGLSGDLRAWSAEDRAEAAELVAAYKRIRHLVAAGTQYRLASGPSVTAVAHVRSDRSEAVLFAWRPSARHGEARIPVRLRGLDPDATYRETDGTAHAGGVLMAHGLDVHARFHRGDYASTVIHLRRD
jgi:alpha-galactosidase